MKIKIVNDRQKLYRALTAIGVIAAITNAVVVGEKVVVRTAASETIEFRLAAEDCWQAKRMSGSQGIACEKAIEVLNSLIA